MDRESNTPAADKQRPQGISATRDSKLHTYNLDPSAYGYHAPSLSDQELVAALVEDHKRTLRNIIDAGPAGPENLTFEQLHLPITDAPIEPLPAILVRDDGATVLYAQRFSSLHGEPGCGKSWMALIASGEAIKKGGRVAWMDAEDRPQTVAERARPLGLLDGVTDPEKFRFFNAPELVEVEAFTQQALAWLLSAPDPRFSLTVIDSAESWGCASDGADVAPWMVKFVDLWRKADVAVLLLDHVPKRPKDRPPGPIGSQHKRARVDGAALRCFGKPWTKAEGGYITLINEKDRVGDLPAGMLRAVATLAGTWDASGGFSWELTAPEAEAESEAESEAAADMETVYQAIKAAGPEGIHGISLLQEAAGIRRYKVIDAARKLVEAHRITKGKEGRGFTYRADETGMTAAQKEDVESLLPFSD